MLLHVLLLLWLPATALALTQPMRGFASSSSSSSTASSLSTQKCGVLPFPLEDLMLPGEERQCFLFEDRFHACLADAVGSNGGRIAALHLTDSGQVCDLSTILQVESMGGDDNCVWAQLRCMGRCRVNKLITKGAYHVARIEPLVDESGAVEKEEEDANDSVMAELRQVHAQAASKRRGMISLLSSDLLESERREERDEQRQAELIHASAASTAAPFGVFEGAEGLYEDEVLLDENDLRELGLGRGGGGGGGGDDFELDGEVNEFDLVDEEAEYVLVGQPWERPHMYGCAFYNCRDRGELDDAESGKELDELVAARREVLLREPSPSQPSSSPSSRENGGALLGAVGDAWACTTEEETSRQLVSFAAAAMLSPEERAAAVLLTSTAERIEFALDALKEQAVSLERMLLEEMAGRS